MKEAELDVWLKQLNLYAEDLAQLYRHEKETRQKLAEEKIVLEYKLRELERLNQLFQEHIHKKQSLEKLLLQLIEDLKRLLSLSSKDEVFSELGKLIARAEDELARIS